MNFFLKYFFAVHKEIQRSAQLLKILSSCYKNNKKTMKANKKQKIDQN
jgi:hypothetical protein